MSYSQGLGITENQMEEETEKDMEPGIIQEIMCIAVNAPIQLIQEARVLITKNVLRDFTT